MMSYVEGEARLFCYPLYRDIAITATPCFFFVWLTVWIFYSSSNLHPGYVRPFFWVSIRCYLFWCTSEICLNPSSLLSLHRNVFFKRLLEIKKQRYLRAGGGDKRCVANEIFEIIRGLTPPGRFLKEVPRMQGAWIELGDARYALFCLHSSDSTIWSSVSQYFSRFSKWQGS